jgi:hypothetical protein
MIATAKQPLTMFWDTPVLAKGGLIFGPLEAHLFMMTKWTQAKNADFTVAANSVLNALDGIASPDHARELFETAISSARLS